MSTVYHSHSVDDTLAWAQKFGQTLQRGDSVALVGNLGAGKTVLSRGICVGLGYQGEVHSPTYTIVNEYPYDPPLYHIDLYRLPPNADFDEIGIEHYRFSDGITLIEWPDRLGEIDLEFTHIIHIESPTETSRIFRIEHCIKNP